MGQYILMPLYFLEDQACQAGPYRQVVHLDQTNLKHQENLELPHFLKLLAALVTLENPVNLEVPYHQQHLVNQKYLYHLESHGHLVILAAQQIQYFQCYPYLQGFL